MKSLFTSFNQLFKESIVNKARVLPIIILYRNVSTFWSKLFKTKISCKNILKYMNKPIFLFSSTWLTQIKLISKMIFASFWKTLSEEQELYQISSLEYFLAWNRYSRRISIALEQILWIHSTSTWAMEKIK